MRIIILVLIVALQSTAFAARATRGSAASDESYWGKKHFVSIVADNWNYKEPGLMEDSGLLYGVNYTFRNNYGSFYYEAGAEILTGTTTYDGQFSNGTPASFDQSNKIYMGQLWFGAQAGSSTAVRLIPKAGILYRKLIDEDDPFLGDYRREQEYFTLPVGLDVFFPTQNGQFVMTGAVSLIFKGRNKTALTNVGNSNDLDVDQDSGMGLSLEGIYLFSNWQIGGFLRMWKVDDSDQQNSTTSPAATPPSQVRTYIEPENETLSFGIKGGVAF